ncbi:hypothetical protein K7432_006024 [Basidiobolus ranarum]|uniref:C2H2-type domain-containing protein n=1 Tax=Basidiobolus ranarum TaxID=34480 RepID=A0ABR2W286_9FUNG
METHQASGSFNSLKTNSFSQKKRNSTYSGFGQERGFNHLSIKVSETLSEGEPISLFKYDDFSPIVDSFVNPSMVVNPSNHQFPSPTPTPTYAKFAQAQYQHPLSQVLNHSDIQGDAGRTATTNQDFTNLQSPAFSVWPYTSPISPAFPTNQNDIYFNNLMMNAPQRVTMDPLYTSMHFSTTLTCNFDSDLDKIDSNAPIHPEHFTSDISTNMASSQLLQGPGVSSGTPSPQLVPDQLSPTFSSALMTPTTENSPNITYAPWEIGLMDSQCGFMDFSNSPTPVKFEGPELSSTPFSPVQPMYENDSKFAALTSPITDSFQPSNISANSATQVCTCTYPNCKKTFSCIYNLRSHYRIHSTERPFKCDSCLQSFSRNHDLKRHQKIHLGIKPYRCAKCDRTFGRLDALKRHTLVKRCAERGTGKEKPLAAFPKRSIASANASVDD